MNKITRKSPANIFLLAVIGVLVALIQGCSGAMSAKMVPESFDIQRKFNNSVAIEVDRTRANDHFEYWVAEGAVQEALEKSVVESGLFSTVTDRDNAEYLLLMEITSVGNFWGLTAKIALNTAWSLADLRDSTDVWKDVVGSEGVATFGEAFAGANRVRMAYERVISQNIQLGFDLLSNSEVKLNP